MKLIRMKKTMAGPGGVIPAGKNITVGDEAAAALVAADAAEIIGHISDQVTVEVLTPDQETAAVAGAPERAVPTKPVKKVSKK